MEDLSLDHPSVSHRHAMLRWVVDLKSRNGTSVNNRAISEPTRLRARDLVSVGLLSAVYRAPVASSLASSSDHSFVRIEEAPVVHARIGVVRAVWSVAHVR
jgi:pSer/pThr/pTyr-binding forkhead associated (FHA) protein